MFELMGVWTGVYGCISMVCCCGQSMVSFDLTSLLLR